MTDQRPQPTLVDLDSLLDDERAAGARITLDSDLEDLHDLPASIGRSAPRTVVAAQSTSTTADRAHAAADLLAEAQRTGASPSPSPSPSGRAGQGRSNGGIAGGFLMRLATVKAHV